MADVVGLYVNDKLVDLKDGIPLLNLDGTVRTSLKGARTGVVSPYQGETPGGTRTRAIVYSRPEPDKDLLLQVYLTDAGNIREEGGTTPPPAADCATEVAAAVTARDILWEDWLLEGAPGTRQE
jgi:hypothetical protein